jgi:uncharacterized membrane protein YdfJ with MMPL/SSD domain
MGTGPESLDEPLQGNSTTTAAITTRPPIVFIQNSYQVRQEMRFIEHNFQRIFRVARFVTSSRKKSFAIVVLFTVLLIPFAYFAWSYDHSDTFVLTIPRNSLSTKAYMVMESNFPKGRLTPYRLLIIPSEAYLRDKDVNEPKRANILGQSTENSLDHEGELGVDDHSTSSLGFGESIAKGFYYTRNLNGKISNKDIILRAQSTTNSLTIEEWFKLIQTRVIQSILLEDEEVNKHIASIESIVWLFGHPVHYRDYLICKKLPTTKFCRHLLAISRETLSSFNTTSTSTKKHMIQPIAINIELNIEPSSSFGNSWLRKIRKKLAQAVDLCEAFGEIHVSEGAAISLDVVSSVYEQFPKAITFTCMIVLLFDGLAFHSLVVPIRALFSIAATLCFVYGSAVLVYQHGLLEWTSIPGFTSPTREIFWVSPIMLFGILCGISLDYDTFTLVRIVEYRSVGFSDTDSVRAGLASSFRIVSTAGIIMTIAFCGMLMSDLPVLNQISFFLVTAVIFDTFLVRMFYVPSLMICLGKYNWFPSNKLAKWETQS